MKIPKKDILEFFIRSGGPGGQKVNKTSSCVYLKHLPTGIEVKCQEERSQHANRIKARRILCEKLSQLNKKQELLEKQRRHSARSRKRKRPLRVKERILEQKKKRSQKKKSRARLDARDYS